MPQQINKRIIFYILIFLILGSINNLTFKSYKYPLIKKIEIDGIEIKKKTEILNKLSFLKYHNLFFLKYDEIDKIINSFSYIEDYSIFKHYPSSLEIKIYEADIFANFKDGKKNFYIGSNGRFIEANNPKNGVPSIFGEFNINNFLKLKKKIDNSNFNYTDIYNVYFFDSNRWDIETKEGILRRLPIENISKALNFSVKLLNKKKFSNIKIIDLRIENQVILNERR